MEEKEQFKEILSNELMCYINDNIQELAEHWVAARRVDEIEDLSAVVTPKTLLIKQDGSMLFLLECAWDIENVIAVKIYPTIAIGSQDLFL